MALPLTRNTTYAASAQVKSLDLNAIQDSIIGGEHGSVKKTFGISGGFVTAGSFTAIAGGMAAVGIADGLQVDLDLVGDTTITALDLYVDQAGATPISWDLGYVDSTGAWQSLATEAGNATTGDKVLNTVISVAINSARAHKLRIVSGQGSDEFNHIRLTFNKS